MWPIRLPSSCPTDVSPATVSRTSRSDERGFTFVEMLIVAVLGVIVLGGIYQLLINQERSFRLQGAMATTQQGMRTA
ncbi:MAG: PilW family protein, partial [Longimicrobiales bacterium]